MRSKIFLVFFVCVIRSFVESLVSVEIVQYTPPGFDSAEVLCMGTLISARNVITTASCIQVVSPFRIAVKRGNGESLFQHTVA